MPKTCHYSDGSTVENAVVVVWECHHTESRRTMYRAFWAASPDADTGSPVIGYCSPGGSWPTIRQVVNEVRKLYGHANEPCYRNGREIYPVNN